jgi:uncharacterized protein
MRVVFDTNVFVSAFAIRGSVAEKAILKIIEQEDVLLVSNAIIDELLLVLSRKFSHDAEQISRIALFLSEIAEWVNPIEPISALKDEPDNRILECAVRGKADIIVTGDRAMLRLRQHEDTRIIELKTYLKEK